MSGYRQLISLGTLGELLTVPYAALDGYLVLDLSDRLAGSFCAKMLGLYGCQIIKIEPLKGDPIRQWDRLEDRDRTDDSPLFLHLNAGKKSITLNLEADGGQQILRTLAQKSDIIVETFTPRLMKSLGINYQSLSKDNPNLIMTSITPFGQSGRYRQHEYTELTIFAMSGAMHREGLPERYPLKYGAEVAQYYAGNIAAAAAVSSLYGVLQGNGGDWIDISIQECMAGHPHQIGRRAPYIYSGELDPRTQPRTSAAGAREPYAVGTFKCLDGHMSFLPLGPRMWPNIAKMIGREDLLDDIKFSTADNRTMNRAELEKIFQDWLNRRTRKEIFEAVQEAGIPGSPILSSDEVIENEQFKARGYFAEVDHPVSGRLKYTGDPFRLTGTPMKNLSPAPMLGQHTEEILRDHVGLNAKSIASLKAKGIT